MSRSFRHVPFFGIARPKSSNARCKKRANRRLRSYVNRLVTGCTDFNDLLLPDIRQLSSSRDFRTGRKVYYYAPDNPNYVSSMRK